MVLQSIGQSVVLASLNSSIRDFVLIGNLATLPQCAEVFPVMEQMYGCHFHIPEYAEFRTALGAALLGREESRV
jgi:type II pantothenate kinase